MIESVRSGTDLVPATMPAAVFDGDGRLALVERPVPSVRHPDDVLIRVEACGICGTDLHILEVPPGHPATPGVVLGHEFVGIVHDAGPEALGVERGGRVAVASNLSCGSCRWCRRGLANHCERFTTLGIFTDGGLARFAVAPARACHPIRRDIAPEVAALTEPLSCVINGVEQAAVVPGEDVAVFGAGPVGLLFLALFRAAGAGRVIVVEPSDARRDVAKQMGADVLVDPGAGDAVAAIREATDGDGASVAVDAVGSLFEPAVASARRAGRVLLFGMNANASARVRPFDLTRNELTVVGTYVGRDVFPKAIRVLERGLFDARPMITHHGPLSSLPAAVDALREGRAVKAVIDLEAAVA